jgi:hypothetical protein
MDKIVELASQYALPAAAATVGAMCLDAKHHIVKDLGASRATRAFRKSVKDAHDRLGDYCTLYHLIESNDSSAEAFWFEGRSWTYGEVRLETDRLAQWFIDQGIKAKGTFPV